MARKRNNDNARMGEDPNRTDLGRTDVERSDSMRSAGASGDGMAGSEGIDEPSTDQTNRMHGNKRGVRGGRTSSRSFSGQGDQKENTSENAEGTGYTGSNTDHSESENPSV